MRMSEPFIRSWVQFFYCCLSFFWFAVVCTDFFLVWYFFCCCFISKNTKQNVHNFFVSSVYRPFDVFIWFFSRKNWVVRVFLCAFMFSVWHINSNATNVLAYIYMFLWLICHNFKSSKCTLIIINKYFFGWSKSCGLFYETQLHLTFGTKMRASKCCMHLYFTGNWCRQHYHGCGRHHRHHHCWHFEIFLLLF